MSQSCVAVVDANLVDKQKLRIPLVGEKCAERAESPRYRAMAVAVHSTSHPLSMISPRKRSHQDIRSTDSPTKWIDEEHFRNIILGFASPQAEHEADEILERQAKKLGITPVHAPSGIDGITSSLSATTISSETHHGSIMSQSTAPTSCASSERRPSISIPEQMNIVPDIPSILEDMNRKRSSGGIRNGLRKMGFSGRKKKTLGSGPSTLSINTISSQMTADTTLNGSVKSPTKSAASIKSENSHYHSETPVVKPVLSQPPPVEPLMDQEALQRSLECSQMSQVQSQQLEEKRRFLEYQTQLILRLVAKRDHARDLKREAYRKLTSEQEEKNEKLVDELEARQLEDEMKQRNEFLAEKRAIQTRLRHMEAYCQTPSPPTSPAQPDYLRGPSIDSAITLPERQITQAHYENLAQAYHARDNMDDLHESRINVLRGRQKRAMQNFMLKKEKEIEALERQLEKECDTLDKDCDKQQNEIIHEFETKRSKLEARWKLQAAIERAKMEAKTGLKHEALPDVTLTESAQWHVR